MRVAEQPPDRQNREPRDAGAREALWRGGQYDGALTSLEGGVLGAAGVLVLTGDAGTGKTMLVHALMDELPPRGVVVGRLLYPVLEDLDFLSGVAEAFGLPGGFKTAEEFNEAFERFTASVAARQGRVLLIIDDAQSLPATSVREVRRLAQRQWAEGTASVSVLLVGHDTLAAAVNTARIEPTVVVELRALTAEESAEFVAFLVRAAGASESLLAPPSIEQIYRESRGVPQHITVRCNRAIASAKLREARRSLGEEPVAAKSSRSPRSRMTARAGIAAAAVALVLAGAGATWLGRQAHRSRGTAADSARTPVESASPAIQPVPRPSAEKPSEPSQPSPAVPAAAAVQSAPDTSAAKAAESSSPAQPAAPEPARAIAPSAPAPDASRSVALPAPAPAPSPAPPAVVPRATRKEPPAQTPPQARRQSTVETPARVTKPAVPSETPGAAAARPQRDSQGADGTDDPGAIIDWMLKGRP